VRQSGDEFDFLLRQYGPAKLIVALYTTLFRDREHFRAMYQHLGYELVFNDKRLESMAVGLRESDIADFFLRPE
jgi:hypothetical protein